MRPFARLSVVCCVNACQILEEVKKNRTSTYGLTKRLVVVLIRRVFLSAPKPIQMYCFMRVKYDVKNNCRQFCHYYRFHFWLWCVTHTFRVDTISLYRGVLSLCLLVCFVIFLQLTLKWSLVTGISWLWTDIESFGVNEFMAFVVEYIRNVFWINHLRACCVIFGRLHQVTAEQGKLYRRVTRKNRTQFKMGWATWHTHTSHDVDRNGNCQRVDWRSG